MHQLAFIESIVWSICHVEVPKIEVILMGLVTQVPQKLKHIFKFLNNDVLGNPSIVNLESVFSVI